MDLGNMITMLRKEKNITQEELAEKMGVSRQAVTKWESNESVPELSKLCALADFLEVSLDKLVGRGDSGIDRIIKKIESYDEPETIFQEEASAIKTTIHKTIEALREQNISDEELLGILETITSDD